MDDLPDELLVMICQYALCLAQGLCFMGEPSFGLGKCKVRCENQKSIAMGLIFTNRRLSSLAIPIVYGENTFCFDTELRATVEFLHSLLRKNLKGIKRIYLRGRLQPYAEESIDGPLLSSMTRLLRQNMSLDCFSIAVPQKIQMEVARGSLYPASNHGQLSSTALDMLQHDCVNEVHFVHKRPVNSYDWEGEASAFGDDVVREYVEHILLDERKCRDLQEQRRGCIRWKCSTPAGVYDKEQLEKRRAAYRGMLMAVKSVWEGEGVTVERRSNYLMTQQSAVVIKRWKSSNNIRGR